MHIWRAFRGGLRGRKFYPNPEYSPVVVRVFRTRSEEMGWWRDAVKLSTNGGKFAVAYIGYTSYLVDWVD